MPIDPFELKSIPKWHPRRLAFTLWSRMKNLAATRRYAACTLPEKIVADSIAVSAQDSLHTAVTSQQMGQLLRALAESERVQNGVCVEVGCYRGVTTRFLATATKRKYVAVDPYQGYGGCAEDYALFQKNTVGISNLVHEATTSGRASRAWKHGPVGFVFIDAVHDYANTAFDIETWRAHMATGAFMALHDTDQRCFAGTRMAAFEASREMTLWCHVDNLVILKKAQ